MNRKIALAVLSSLLATTIAAMSDHPASAQNDPWTLYNKELKYLAKKGIPHPWGLPNPYEGRYRRNLGNYNPYGFNPYVNPYAGYPYNNYNAARFGNVWF